MLNVTVLTREAKVEEAIKRGVLLLPGNIAAQLRAMLTPASLAILVSSILALAVAQAFGVGEVADLLLLGIGLGFCGWGVFDGLRDLGRFANAAMQANSEADLDQAARYFASAITKLGVNTVMAILMKKPIRSFREVDGFKFKNVEPGLRSVKPPPPPGVKPTVSYVDLGPDYYGNADSYGNIKINSQFSPEEQQMTLDHESVHAFFSPKLGRFRQVRARLAMSGYARSPLLRYIEEALAESYAQVRAQGIRGVITGVRFPLMGRDPYITVEQRSIGMGTFIGIISIQGHLMNVTVSHGHAQPNNNPNQQSAATP